MCAAARGGGGGSAPHTFASGGATADAKRVCTRAKAAPKTATAVATRSAALLGREGRRGGREKTSEDAKLNSTL